MESRQMKILLFSENEERIRFFENYLNPATESFGSMDVCSIKISTEEIFLRYAPNLVIIDFASLSAVDREYLMSKLERVSEVIPLVGIFEPNETEEILSFVKRGIRDHVELPLKDFEVVKIFQRFKKFAGGTAVKKLGKIYSFFSFKGGVGNTFVTVNTAVSLARNTKKRILLWDMALQAGDIPFFLNFKPEYNLAEIINNVDQIDEAYIEGVLKPHESGISILPAPEKIEDIERLNPQMIEKILNPLVSYYDYVLIDCGYRLTDTIMPLLDASLYLFVTTTLELISLRSASRCLNLLERLNYSPEKIKIVVNRFSSKFESITLQKAREILRYNLVQMFSNDYITSSQSVNLGQSVIDTARESVIAKQFTEFARKIEHNFHVPEKSKRIFHRVSLAIQKVIGNVPH